MSKRGEIDKINILIGDLAKSAQQRQKGSPSCFTEELLIIRLKDIQKEVESND